jgi:hypothetical protein
MGHVTSPWQFLYGALVVLVTATAIVQMQPIPRALLHSLALSLAIWRLPPAFRVAWPIQSWMPPV